MRNIQDVTPEMVRSAYSGRIGCMCGCKGTHWYREAAKAEGGKDRGYKVDDCEVNDGQVTKILRMLQAHEELVEVQAPNIYYAEVGKKAFCVYLTRAAEKAVDTCSVCGKPAHASETDDADRCEACAANEVA